MNRILITGSNGQLGSEIKFLSTKTNFRTDKFFFTDYEELDITDQKALDTFIEINRINVIVNCAAYTAVDRAETEFNLARKVNADSSRYLAIVAKKFNCKFIHISTDYVFDGTGHRPYIESDATNPKSIYGITKLEGEKFILEQEPENTIIIRTSWVYSRFGNNFVKTMVRLGKEKEKLHVIDDQIGTPTYAMDLANAILKIIPNIKNKEIDIFHFSNEGVCSWYDFAKAIFEINKTNCLVYPITTSMYPTAAKRPSYSVLNKTKIKTIFNLEIPYWRDSLIEYFNTAY